jgi:SpoIIAA-like
VFTSASWNGGSPCHSIPADARRVIDLIWARSTLGSLIETVTDLPAGILGFRAAGKITSDEYRQMMEPIYAALERREQLNLYFELAEDFHGLDSGALWQDLQAAGSVGLKHRSSWERMALVTDKDWVRHGASAFGWLAPGELRLFDPSERDEARAWLGEPSSS